MKTFVNACLVAALACWSVAMVGAIGCSKPTVHAPPKCTCGPACQCCAGCDGCCQK